MSLRYDVSLVAIACAGLACASGGVGDPCVPEDEYQAFFAGYDLTEVNIESSSVQCETRVCLVNHFRGRASCPYGQTLRGAAAPRCHIPGSSDSAGAIRVDVRPQIVNRRAADAVYCSCRCDGPDPLARYCHCPDGFTCTELLRDIGVGGAELSGSYCIKAGTEYDSAGFASAGSCEIGQRNCGPENGG